MATTKNHPRPDHVFVGSKTYDILWLSEDEWVNQHLNDGDAGLTYAGRNHIYMRLMPGSTEGNYQEVLLHEVTHAVWCETALTHQDFDKQPKEDLEEFVISIQSPGLLLVLQQNPHVMLYLNSNPAARRR